MSNKSTAAPSEQRVRALQAHLERERVPGDLTDDSDVGPPGARDKTHDRAAVIRRMVRSYRVAFVASLALSVLVAILSAEALVHGWKATDLGNDLVTPLTTLGHVIAQSGEPDAPASADQLLQRIYDRLHPAPTLIFAGIQVLAVVAISIMWFHAFQLREMRRHPDSRSLPLFRHSAPVVASFLPVVIFVMAMYQAYQPAVLVMALLAILVAAEHYSGLKLQEDELEAQQEQLRQQHGEHARQAERLGRLLSDAGLSHFVGAVYREYERATRIRAVVRLHDVDYVWWAAAAVAIDQGSSAAANDPWEDYFALAADRTTRTATLARALALDGRAELSGAFVTDLPLPASREWNQRKHDGKEPLFADLLGLAWQLVVVHHACAGAPGKCTVSAWVSRPLCWVHATDRMVFQVLRREPRDQSAVIVIADLTQSEFVCTPAEIVAYTGLVAWAHDEIQRYVDRGSRADEYIVAAIRYAMLEASKDDTTVLVRIERNGATPYPRATDDLRYLLGLLAGGDDFVHWMKSQARSRAGPARIREDKTLATLAADVFARLLHDCIGPAADATVITGRDLALEVL